ncbi:MAG: hypothetical protein E6Q98_15815 [Rhodospirillaceae bacterium]|nr:MAG: hypothetical protein E6Q98_15815 [Rhodospirillaceae bacterium]
MSALARMKALTAAADQFNGCVSQVEATLRELCLRRDLLVAETRDFGILKDEAEAMFAKIKFEVTMPAPEPAAEVGQPDAAQPAPAPWETNTGADHDEPLSSDA